MIVPLITGLGIVSSIGNNVGALTASLHEMRHGIRPWEPGSGEFTSVRVAGLVQGFDVGSHNPAAWRWPEEFPLDPVEFRAMPPHGVYALAAVHQALAEAGLAREDLGDGTTGLACASGGSARQLFHHLKKMEESGWRRIHPHAIVSTIAGSLNFHLGALLGIRGASCGFTSACASGSHALGYACDEIRLGRQQRMIVVAAEDLDMENVLPFGGMGALSGNTEPGLASRPFDCARDGFVPTGGSVGDGSRDMRFGASAWRLGSSHHRRMGAGL